MQPLHLPGRAMSAEPEPEPSQRRWTFTIHGTVAPQGSKRHVGRGIMVESSAAVRPWREAIKAAAADVLGDVPLPLFPKGVPVTGRIVFSMRRPKNAPRNKRVWPAGPDLDKALRSTGDGLTEAGVWHDDRQLKDLRRLKLVYAGDQRFGEPEALDIPGALISLWRLG